MVTRENIRHYRNDRKGNDHLKWALLENGEIVKMYWDVEIGYSTKYHGQDADVKYSFLEYRYTSTGADGNILALTEGIMHGTKDRYIHYSKLVPIIAESNLKKELEQYKKELGIKRKRKMTPKQVDKFLDTIIQKGAKNSRKINQDNI